jgi:hypothetical protein
MPRGVNAMAGGSGPHGAPARQLGHSLINSDLFRRLLPQGAPGPDSERESPS